MSLAGDVNMLMRQLDFLITETKDQSHVSIIIFNSLGTDICLLTIKISIKFLCVFVVVIGSGTTPKLSV